MDQGAFLVARLALSEAVHDYDWLCADSAPYEPIDPIDFLTGDEIAPIYRLYQAQYGASRPPARDSSLVHSRRLEATRLDQR